MLRYRPSHGTMRFSTPTSSHDVATDGAAPVAMSGPLIFDEVREVGAAVVVRLSGEIDLDVALEFRSGLLTAAENGPNVVVDFTDVTFIDSSGLSALILASRDIAGRGGTLVLAGPRGAVREVLSTTRLDQVLTVAGTVPEALDLVSSSGPG
jgi:anti-sigma B factor antagonist